MADRFLKHVPTGITYIWQSAFASNPDFVECADADGNDFQAPTKGKKAKVSAPDSGLDVDLDAALSADASRGV